MHDGFQFQWSKSLKCPKTFGVPGSLCPKECSYWFWRGLYVPNVHIRVKSRKIRYLPSPKKIVFFWNEKWQDQTNRRNVILQPKRNRAPWKFADRATVVIIEIFSHQMLVATIAMMAIYLLSPPSQQSTIICHLKRNRKCIKRCFIGKWMAISFNQSPIASLCAKFKCHRNYPGKLFKLVQKRCTVENQWNKQGRPKVFGPELRDQILKIVQNNSEIHELSPAHKIRATLMKQIRGKIVPCETTIRKIKNFINGRSTDKSCV